ncbi:hypothetical protein [uncultured Chryseobacterium sp.]|uniref:hypothetical protein n=1 Tax=uncultured Chryseobacterium sp. TaxID=259322 RepID=UPI00262CC774|nr:hypothetical protein [uncultured Chryseobacterium sp.]
MKKLLLLFLFLGQFIFAQMPNIEKVWLNNSKPYVGTISGAKSSIKLKINVSDQNRKNDQEYFVAGYSIVEGSNYAKFEGKLKITKYKDSKKRGTVFGEYELAEEPKGQHSGIFKGKFIYTFRWNKDFEKIEDQYIEFIGDWYSYDKSLSFKTNWNNQPQK